MPLGVLAAAASSSSSVSDVEPGVLGFLIVAAMGLALVFLLRSMNKQFRKITPEPGPDASAGDDASAASGASGAPADEQAPAPAKAPK